MRGLILTCAVALALSACDSDRDFAVAELDEGLSGGATTLQKLNPGVELSREAYSQPAANLAPAQRSTFAIGNAFFTNPWVVAPADSAARDGLGPLYNASACQDCHIRDGRGHPPLGPDDSAISALLRVALPQSAGDAAALERAGVVADPVYGGQIQDRAVPGVAPEARLAVNWRERELRLAGGEVIRLREPLLTLEALGYGELHPQARYGLRVAPPMIGLGLLEAIPAEDILAGADPDDRDGDGISGRANRVWDIARAESAVGRFGWKAGQPTVRQQSLAAFVNDIGITSLLLPAEICSPAQRDCAAAASGGEPELDANIEDAVVFYSSHLAVPARRWVEAPEVLAGKQLFHSLGCASCHRPRWRTGELADAPALSRQLIWPYTDMLLHDMGEALADGVEEFAASGREWRTPPLWGIHLAKAVGGSEVGFLHDGRARNFKEAIAWHGGEAATSRDAWVALPKRDRENLIWFLKSL